MTQFANPSNQPKGGTDLTKVLIDALPAEASGKPQSILIITDGCPDDARSTEDLIINTINSLPSPDDLSLTFIQVGDDTQGNNYLEELDNTLKSFPKKLSIVFAFAGDSTITKLLIDFEKKQSGFIVGVSSVAADRGRKSNYIYGASKAGFDAYLSGLRNRLFESNVSVLTVRPGFVATKMTQHLALPHLLTAKPNQVANAIFKAQQKKKNSAGGIS